MLSAAIDVGSNTLRLVIGSMREGRVTRVWTGRSVTRLAEGLKATGRLGVRNMEKSVDALRHFSDVLSSRGVQSVKAVGTSALREARNSGDFISTVFRETGIAIDVISGEREARLTAKGVLAGCGRGDAMLAVDIGGGSTEWAVANSSGCGDISCGSLPLGVVRLHEHFVMTDPPTQTEAAAIISDINATFVPGNWGIAAQGEVPANATIRPSTLKGLIGTGGTITTLAAIDLGLAEYDGARVHLHAIHLERLYQLRDLFFSLPLRDREALVGLEEGRADLIIPGILLTIRLTEFFGLDGITVSDYGILEGLLQEMDNDKGL